MMDYSEEALNWSFLLLMKKVNVKSYFHNIYVLLNISLNIEHYLEDYIYFHL